MNQEPNQSEMEQGRPRLGGDQQVRQRAALLIENQREVIYRRISALLLPEARKIVDTEEILSTALRRVDRLILHGRFNGERDEQLYALVHRVLERTIKEKARNARRLRRRERLAAEMRDQTNIESVFPSPSVCQQLGALTTDPIDREIALLRGRGLKFHEIAVSMQMQPAGVRKRWSRLKERAQEVLRQEQDRADY